MRKINILILFILITLGSYAQNRIDFSTTSYTITGLSNFNVNDSIFVDSLNTPTGTLFFAARVDITLLTAPQFISSPDSISIDSLSLGTYKQVSFTINNDTAPPFVVGPNTVVIWPVYNNSIGYVSPNDSIYIHVTYDTLTGIGGTSLAKMFIFQTPGRLNVNFGDAENLIQQVSIYDILGQGMYAGSAERSKNIPTSGWTTGVYLCEITTYSGEKRTIKFRLE